MKILALVCLSITCYGQLSDIQLKTHTVNGSTITTIDSVKRIWKNHRDVTPKHGMIYDYRLGDDTARYFHKIPGKNMRAHIVFYDEAIGLPDGEPIPEETITIIDSAPTNPANKYYGSWQHRSGASWLSNFHEQTGSYTTGTADSLVIMVDGYKVEWFSETAANHGIAEVRIDNKFAAGIDLYSATTANKLVWTGLMLTDGPHKITIRYTGQKNASATQDNIIHDYIKVFSK